MTNEQVSIVTYAKYLNAIEDYDNLRSFIEETKGIKSAHEIMQIGQKFVNIIPENFIN